MEEEGGAPPSGHGGLRIETASVNMASVHEALPTDWPAPSTPLASPTSRKPSQSGGLGQFAQFTTPGGQMLSHGSPYPSPIASSSYSGYATTPGSEISTSSMSSYASDKRMFAPAGEPTPSCSPYPGFQSAVPLDNEPTAWGTFDLPNAAPAAPLATAPILGRSDGHVSGYFDMPSFGAEQTPLQAAAASFDRLFGNWRIFVDGGRAEDPAAGILRGQMDAAYVRMMEIAKEREMPARKRMNSISSTPNPAPIKLRRESISKPPLVHAHSTPVVPMLPSPPSGVPTFASRASSATPASQATIDGLHFGTSTPPPPLVIPSPTQHPPHTPSPLANGILAPVLLQAETSLNLALADALPTAVSVPNSPRLRSELAQVFLESAIPGQMPNIPRQPPNPRSFGGPHLRTQSENSLPSTTMPMSHRSSLSWSAADSMDIKEDLLTPILTPAGSPRERDTDAFDDDDDDMSVDMPVVRRTITSNGPLRSTGPSVAEPLPLKPEQKTALDDLFIEFLNKLCCDGDYKDSKGELVHQALKASKMKKMVEAGEYRPFKFRIQAFTNAYSEHLAANGFTEQDISLKVVRQYLWQQPLISRFNDEGKKSKSKGNHIWTIEGRLVGEDKWQFREFHRRLVMPSVKALPIGGEFSWTPYIWDPQGLVLVPHTEISPMPHWLQWIPSTNDNRGAELRGILPLDLRGPVGPFETRTAFVYDGETYELAGSFTINIAGDEKTSRSRASSVKESQTPVLAVKQQPPPVPIIPMATDTPVLPSMPAPPASSVINALEQQAAMQTLAPAFSAPPVVQPAMGDFLQAPLLAPPLVEPMPALPMHMAPTATQASTIAPSALSAAARVDPLLGDLLSPINLLKEEMIAVPQRPGPIEQAVIAHQAVQETLAQHSSPAVAQQAFDALNQAQQQVNEAVSAAQGRKLDELLPASKAMIESPIVTGVSAPPPTPVAGLQPHEVTGMPPAMFMASMPPPS